MGAADRSAEARDEAPERSRGHGVGPGTTGRAGRPAAARVDGWARLPGADIAYLAAGEPDAPLALCLHGFPDHARTFRHLLPVLAEAGYRAVAPYLRGYPPSSPVPTRGLDPETLTADVNGLAAQLSGGQPAALVGHDWGAIAAHRAAVAVPERWSALVTMAVPPEPLMQPQHLSLGQARRSWYTMAAQLPGAERLFLADDLARIDRLWEAWSPGYRLEPEEREALHETLGAPGAMRSALAYYRGFAAAVLTGRAAHDGIGLPPQPHLLLHGSDDGCISPAMARAAEGRLPHPDSRVEVLPGVGHFLHLEAPRTVAGLVLEHLGPPSP